MKLPSPTLTGRHVRLEQLGVEHIEALVAAANEDRSTYTWTAVPATVEAMTAYVTGLLADQERGEVVPFVQRRTTDDAPVGCTRFLRLEWWAAPGAAAVDPAGAAGRTSVVRAGVGSTALADELEIGGTWLAASAQRTPINTEAKLLLLRHAFDEWHVARVAVCTDARNTRSRTAIERIGATFEGILRRHRASYVAGEGARDSAMYSVIAPEWPAVEAGLVARLDGRG
jgi:RimJ/RimL family protein N-acetyltransferase